MANTASKTGYISQIIGPVVDVEFPSGDLPKVYNAILVGEDKNTITCEVQQLLGNNKVRAEKYTLLKNAGFKMLSIVHPQALIDTKVTYGDNVIIEMGTAIHTNSTIGNNVFLGGDALIGHHNIIGNHVLVGGNVSFGGAVIVEDYVSIGVGASIKPGVRLGKGSVVGVGAAVVKDVNPGDVVVGVPAKPIK